MVIPVKLVHYTVIENTFWMDASVNAILFIFFHIWTIVYLINFSVTVSLGLQKEDRSLSKKWFLFLTHKLSHIMMLYVLHHLIYFRIKYFFILGSSTCARNPCTFPLKFKFRGKVYGFIHAYFINLSLDLDLKSMYTSTTLRYQIILYIRIGENLLHN